MKLDLPARRPRRRINLTPMIDVVLMLLIFFMMVSRFGGQQGLPLTAGTPQPAAEWQGPPRLVRVTGTGVLLNGQPIAPAALAAALRPLMTDATDPVVIRAEDAPVQALVDVMAALRAAGLSRLILMGEP